MILVLLGTQKQDFTRLVENVERLVIEKNIKEEILIQIGNTKYSPKSKNINCKKYLENYEEEIKRAKLIISHGGVGSIMDGLKENKIVLAMPRLSPKEHVDDHQKEIVNKFLNESYILGFNNYQELEELYENKIKKFKKKKYNFNNENFNKKLNKLLSDII